jgi:broad specificity phosphatase PhoE
MNSNRILWAAWLGILILATTTGTTAAESWGERLSAGGRVLMIRHAYAPGTGDPADFRIGDCATQRNLNEVGREQAQRIGGWLRAQGVAAARVYSSQWCRCLETAKLLGLGSVMELPALNSFYGRPEDREPNLSALREFLAQQPAQGQLIVLVTHFVTISAIAGQGVSSGEGVLLALDGRGGFAVVQSVGFR